MASEITITLSGSESEAQFSGANAWLRNDGAATIYAAKAAGVTAGAAGVVAVPAGGSAPVYGANGRVWQFGTIRPEGARGAVDANFAYEQLGRVIREQGLNAPAKVVLRAQKTVTAGAAAKLTEELEGRGFRVSARKV